MPAAEKLITMSDQRAPAAEAYRTLRTNLMFSSLERPLRTLLVTAPAPEEAAATGKSLALANLAVTMAQGGRQTLLVDCDLRRPQLHDFFGLPREPGLTNLILEADGNAEPALAQTGVPNLSFLPAGPLPPNPADLLTSRRMEAVIASLQARADLVLFDAPPVLAATDAALLASKVDGVLLVIQAGRTRREHALRARELLEKINVRLVGAVLADAAPDTGLRAY